MDAILFLKNIVHFYSYTRYFKDPTSARASLSSLALQATSDSSSYRSPGRILVEIGILIVLPAWFPSDVRQVCSASWPESMNAATGSSAICPTAAFSGEIGTGKESIAVLDKRVGSMLLRHNACNTLATDFAKDFSNVCCLCFDGVWDCPRRSISLRT
jgi:hypothetical protein